MIHVNKYTTLIRRHVTEGGADKGGFFSEYRKRMAPGWVSISLRGLCRICRAIEA